MIFLVLQFLGISVFKFVRETLQNHLMSPPPHRTHVDHSRFFCIKIPIWNLFLSRCIVELEGNETQGNQLLIMLQHFYRIFSWSFHNPKKESYALHCTAYSWTKKNYATIQSFVFKKFTYCSHDLTSQCCDSCMMIRCSSVVDSITFIAVPHSVMMCLVIELRWLFDLKEACSSNLFKKY
jgi:hypothetical protein